MRDGPVKLPGQGNPEGGENEPDPLGLSAVPVNAPTARGESRSSAEWVESDLEIGGAIELQQVNPHVQIVVMKLLFGEKANDRKNA